MKFGPTEPREPILYVAELLNTKFNEHSPCMLTDLANVHIPTANAKTIATDSGIWIYDMRPSDYLPKSTAETERLYAFVKALLRKWFDDIKTCQYLEKNIHISVSFFIWYFSTPNYFYATKEIRHTTRYGVQRKWNTILFAKEPNQLAMAPNSSLPQPAKLRRTTNTQLPKQRQEQERLQLEISRLIHSEHPECHLEWRDATRIHMRISECITNMESDYYVSGKKQKKIQKLYKEYTTVTSKINKGLERERIVENSNLKLAPNPITIPCASQAWCNELGAPPSPPTLKRLPFETGSAEDLNIDNGEGAPDSWEDIVF